MQIDNVQKSVSENRIDEFEYELRKTFERDEKNFASTIYVMESLLSENSCDFDKIVSIISEYDLFSRAATEKLIPVLRTKPNISPNNWTLIEKWLVELIGHWNRNPGDVFDHIQANDLIARLKTWFWDDNSTQFSSELLGLAKRLLSHDFEREIQEGGQNVRAIGHVTRLLIDIGESQTLDKLLEAHRARLKLPTWMAVAEYPSNFARLEASALLCEALKRDPAQARTAYDLAKILPDEPSVEAISVLRAAIRSGASIDDTICSWINRLLLEKKTTVAKKGIQAFAQELGVPAVATKWSWSECLNRNGRLWCSISLRGFYMLLRDLRFSVAPEEVRVILRVMLDRNPADEDLLNYAVDQFVRMGSSQEAFEYLERKPASISRTAALACSEAEVHHDLGHRDKLIATLKEAFELLEGEKSRGAVRGISNLSRRLEWLQMVVDTGEIVASIPVSGPVRGIVAIVALRSPMILVWATLTACELRKRGYETVFIDSPACSAHSFVLPEAELLDGLVMPKGGAFVGEALTDEPHPGWVGNWPAKAKKPDNRNLIREGYDVFQAIYERIGTSQKRYNLVDDDFAEVFTAENLVKADTAIRACAELDKFIEKTGLNVIVLSSMIHYVPTSIYEQHARIRKNDGKMTFVEVNNGYEYYKTNNTLETGYTISVGNLTKNTDQRTALHTNRKSFETWLSNRAKRADEEVEEVLKIKRSDTVALPELEAVKQSILTHRKKGGRVIGLMGKITYDIGIQKEGGPAHWDMTDWLNHSIDAVRGCDDVLLLIKPHPYEVDPQVAQANEQFADLISVDLPENCIVLGHRWFSLSEMLPMTDALTIWHGTATLEAIAQGIPVIVCSSFGVIDHPIEVIEPKDRDHYAQLLTRSAIQPVSAEQRQRARDLIAYLVSDEIMIPYPYASIHVMRVPGERVWQWRWEQVNQYLAHGDKYMQFTADLCEFGIAGLTQ